MSELPSMEKLTWQCRRGMLELDLLLREFLDNKYNSLKFNEKLLFNELLTHNDQDLQQWLLNKTSPVDNRLLKIIDLINEK
ncbi:MAG: succinate dehydrogenase assembly factor 2 [Gammaproteobacteria bacterium]|jgi:antitoxin CptB